MQAGEKSVAERGEEKMVQIVKDLDAAKLSLRSSFVSGYPSQ